MSMKQEDKTARWSTNDMTTWLALLRDACTKWPDKIFLESPDRRYSYRAVDQRTNALGHGFAALGITQGDRVCLFLDNHLEAVLLWIAVNKLAAVTVFLNTALKGEFLRHQIADSGAKLILCERDYVARVLAVEQGIPETELLVCRGATPEVASRLEVKGFETISSGDETAIDVPVGPRDLSMIVYTSGTTGPSKGCMVSHNYACAFGRLSARGNGLRHGDVFWTPAPVFHVGATLGVITAALTVGATASIYPRFSLSGFWPEILRSKATVVMLLSTMFALVADAPDTEDSRRCHGQLRVVSGVPISGKIKKTWQERFGVTYMGNTGYGTTECSPTTRSTLEDSSAPADASGRVSEYLDVRVIDDAGNECPPGVPGEVIIRPLRPYVMFHGYWRRPESTIEAWEDLWFHVGDIGKFDEDGYFYFVDRKKDYLRRGGENISSFELEASFSTHPMIEEVAVHSVLSDVSEDEVKVTAILKAGASLMEYDLCIWSIDCLPRYAVPRYIEFRKEFPRTATGRVQKYALRSEGVTPTTWDRSKTDLKALKR